MSLRSFLTSFLLSSALLFFIGGLIFLPTQTHADTAADLQAQIAQHNKQISDLETEIAGYQKQLNVISGQKQTLQSQINTLDISRKKILAQITVTQNQIAATNLKLRDLGVKIVDKSEAITLEKKAVAASMRTLQSTDNTSLIEQLLDSDSIADTWIVLDQAAMVREALRKNTEELSSAKTVLVTQKDAVTKTQAELSKFNKQLQSQKGELDANKVAKEQLLKETKTTETTYQSIIAKKTAQRKAFESELSALEDSLKVAINPASIAHVGTGVLAWPFNQAFATACLGKAKALGNNYCVTQFFGTTPFSTANPQVYNGAGHNAIDIGMPSGTPVLAALSGTVIGTGNTDTVFGCYSYGKWVLVKHANGLDTLYAHLSSISVSTGQTVSTGSTLGYSGMTGYATGPHLHFGVYVSSATKILTLQQYRGATSPCANATMPVAPKEGYLNPMSYL